MRNRGGNWLTSLERGRKSSLTGKAGGRFVLETNSLRKLFGGFAPLMAQDEPALGIEYLHQTVALPGVVLIFDRLADFAVIIIEDLFHLSAILEVFCFEEDFPGRLVCADFFKKGHFP